MVPESTVSAVIASHPDLCYIVNRSGTIDSARMQQGKTKAVQELPLRGVRVLVVEDEYYIADDVRRELSAAGARIVGPISSIAKAHEALDKAEFDCALLDLNLHGDSALPIADRLVEQGKSFAIATGYGSSVVPERLKAVPRVEKPFDPPALLRLVSALSSREI